MGLINKDLLLSELSKNSITEKITIGDKSIYDIVKDFPQVDAVKVIRCIDCKKYETLLCSMYSVVLDECFCNRHDFCSYGVKKNE